ncbi:hypothetical protein [Rhodopirellula europaea]|uniref:Uncharacterized protein n=2 Tax=Pirellulaceae TaxID=2691357 RepID=M5S1J3_9BACT|nr:hypothetical protein [Rhodopirellula europaea]EMI25291.1 hypothetical protein RESH_04116 [Rhodopirellula europaea SH398]
MDTTTYKLARSVGGRCNFAETTVSIVRDASMNAAFISSRLDDPNLAWAFPHAVAGAHQALIESELNATSVEIVAIRVTEVDSNPHIVAVSAYIAAAQALSADRMLQSFVINGRLEFPALSED